MANTQAFTAYASGLKDTLNLQPKDINAWDWAWSLQHQGRFSGSTPVMWSVLSHLGLCYMLAMRDTQGQLSTVDQLSILLHDASEGYMVDMPRPIKTTPEWSFFRSIEDRITETIFSRFSIPQEQVNWDLIHRYDNQALHLEFVAFFPHVMEDKNFIPTKAYEMPYTVDLVVAKPVQYIELLRHLAINLRESVEISAFDDLFRMPPHLAPYVGEQAVEQEPDSLTSPEDRVTMDSLLNRRLD